MIFLFLAVSLRALAGAPVQETSASLFSRAEASVFTVEIHTGNAEAKTSLGSGYVISADGKVVTNYHVVSAYVDDPSQKFIRVRNVSGQRPAMLLAFDVANDLALLKISGSTAPPLRVAAEPPPPGTEIVALGNPHGLRLSIVEGIFNGYAEKGLVDRMVLSMPLNAGMSGGPILNGHGEVIGTNVAIYRSSNSLSFGVPGTKLKKLLAATPVATSADELRRETHRQLVDLERETSALLHAELEAGEPGSRVTVGGVEIPLPRSLFECWETTKKNDDATLNRSRYRCDLQFTPSLDEDEEVAAVEIEVEHVSSDRNRYGFYGWLSENGGARVDSGFSGIGTRRTAPECVVERVASREVRWKVNTCLRGYLKHEGLYDFSLAATSLSRAREAVTISLLLKGFSREAFSFLARFFLDNVRFTSAP